MFIPELTTRVTVKTNTSEIDEAISKFSGDPILSIFSDVLEEKKKELTELEEPLADAVAEQLSSIQETIISTKHYANGLMSNSVDIQMDGRDRLVGNTASSIDGFPYPLGIEKGTKDHWVAPVTFSALHWGGHPGFFSKGHMVSGITADPYVDYSIDETMDVIDSIFSEL